MKTVNSTWKIRQVVKLANDKKLVLNPPYQRKDIWTSKAKSLLIQSLIEGFPIPNFIFYEYKNGNYEVVDGQQRIRTILGYLKGIIKDTNKDSIDDNSEKIILNYPIQVTIVSDLQEDEKIELVYDRINSTGLHLNRPELNKAAYFETNFQKLIETLASDKTYQSLELFSESTINRMNDVEFTSELLALLILGISDKKKNVDKIYNGDIKESDIEKYKKQFNKIISVFDTFNKVFPLKNTRYKQRNDFYTYFGFVKDHELDIDTHVQFYKLMTVIGNDISPSNDDCQVLQDYAFNCVSQSNSKDARESRLSFFKELLLNTDEILNETQLEILEFYDLDNDAHLKLGEFLTLDYNVISEKLKEPIEFYEV